MSFKYEADNGEYQKVNQVDLLDKIRQVAKQFPDYRNPGACQYCTTKGAHCIVGQALAEMGLPNPHKYINSKPWEYILRNEILNKNGNGVEQDQKEIQAIKKIGNIQEEADSGARWGSCLEEK